MSADNINLTHTQIRLFVLGVGLSVITMSAIVMYGWLVKSQAIVTVLHGHAPMQFNTALCLFISALGLISLQEKKYLLSRLCAMLVIAISGISLVEYLNGTNIGLDEFFAEAFVSSKTSHPGRMSPNTAIGFIICAACMHLSRNPIWLMAASSSIIFLAIVSLVANFASLDGLYGVASLSRMAIHTSVGFLLLGLGFLSLSKHSIKSNYQRDFNFWSVLPIVIFSALLTITASITINLQEILSKENNAYFQGLISESEHVILERFHLYEQTLMGGIGFIHASKHIETAEWREYVDFLDIHKRLPGINGIGYIEPSQPDNQTHDENDIQLIIKHIEPAEQNQALKKNGINHDTNIRNAAITSKQNGTPIIAKTQPYINGYRTSEFIIMAPIYTDLIHTKEHRSEGHFRGWIFAPFIARSFFNDIPQASGNQLNFKVYETEDSVANTLFYEHIDQGVWDTESQYSHKSKIELFNQNERWTILWAPSSNFKPPVENVTVITSAFFVIGTVISLVLAEFFYLLSTLYGGSVRDLRKAIQRAENALEAKSQFLANMSHEIRTPMNGIMGTIELIKETGLTDQQLKYTNIIRSSGKTLLEILNEILDFSKIEAGKFELHPSPFNLSKSLEEQVALLQPLAQEKRMEITYELDGRLPRYIVADEVRVKQIVTNFISNALKFTDEGLITLNISRAPDNNTIKFTVTDTGLGIPKDQQDRIFGTFTQIQSDVGHKPQGTGLGLAISKHLTGMMGGDIGVISEHGQGASFWFKIPLEEPTREQIKEVESRSAAENNLIDANFAAKILIAEDVITNQFVVTNILSSLGCETEIAHNGKEAFEMCWENTYDLILMDCQMPVMDGYEATQRIKASKKDLPIVALTANAVTGDREKCLKAGMDDFITKPISKADIVVVLETWVPHTKREKT